MVYAIDRNGISSANGGSVGAMSFEVIASYSSAK